MTVCVDPVGVPGGCAHDGFVYMSGSLNNRGTDNTCIVNV